MYVEWLLIKSSPIALEEKETIRSKLLVGVGVRSSPLAAQHAVAMSRIARIDFPTDYPSVLDDLVRFLSAAAHSDDIVGLQNGLYTTKLIVKILSASRIRAMRLQFEQHVPSLFSALVSMYQSYVAQWKRVIDQEKWYDTSLIALMKTTLLCIKVFRHLVAYGYENPHDVGAVRDLLDLLTREYGYLNSLGTHENDQLHEIRNNHILALGKLWLNLAETSPLSFLAMPSAMTVLEHFWNVLFHNERIANEEDTFQRKVTLQALLIYHYAFKIRKLPTTLQRSGKGGAANPQLMHCIEGWNTFLLHEHANRPFIATIVETLICRFLILKKEDLESWQERPEEWFNDEDQGAWETEIRPCVKSLILDMHGQSDVVAQTICTLLQNHQHPKDFSQLLTLDAVFCAIGLDPDAIMIVSQDFFNNWITSFALSSMGGTDTSYKIVRRNISYLLGQGFGHFSEENRSQAFHILDALLDINNPLNDIVVRLQASEALRSCVTDWNFQITYLQPSLNITIPTLVSLAQEVTTADCKLKVMNTLSSVIERMDQAIVPYIETILKILPSLWTQESEGHLLKAVVVNVLTVLTEAARTSSGHLHSIVVPLIKHGTDPSNLEYAYLLEDILTMWITVVQYSSELSADLSALFPVCIDCLRQAAETEILKEALNLLQSYLYIEAPKILQVIETRCTYESLLTL